MSLVRRTGCGVLFMTGITSVGWGMTPGALDSLIREKKLEQAAPAAGAATPRVAALHRYWEYQGDLPLCAFYTEKHVLEAYLGQRLPADQLFDWYAASGTFDVRAQGVAYDRMGAALKIKGYSLQHLTLTEASLKATIAKGFAVLVPVNPLFYWSPDDPMVDFQVDLQRRVGDSGVHHVVWILDATPSAIYLQDSAVQRGGSALSVRWEDFRRAWAPAKGAALVVERVLPALDPDGDGVPITDADFDGHAAVGTGGNDCDDSASAIHPGAHEVLADGIDQDCDGTDADPVRAAQLADTERRRIEALLAAAEASDAIAAAKRETDHSRWTSTLLDSAATSLDGGDPRSAATGAQLYLWECSACGRRAEAFFYVAVGLGRDAGLEASLAAFQQVIEADGSGPWAARARANQDELVEAAIDSALGDAAALASVAATLESCGRELDAADAYCWLLSRPAPAELRRSARSGLDRLERACKP